MPADAALCQTGLTVSVRPPVHPELRACRMLLPEIQKGVRPRDFRGSDPFLTADPFSALLAVTDRPLRILGAAAYTPVLRHGTTSLRLVLRVIKPFRRQGIGSQLLQSVVAEVRRRAIGTLTAWHDPDQEPEGGFFLRARGFTLEDRFTTFEADERLVNLLCPIRDRLIARGKVPRTARLVSLREAPLDQVSRMYAHYIADLPPDMFPSGRLTIERESLTQASVVLMIDDQVQGLLLVAIEGALAKVEARFVASRYQGGWANVLLMATALERGLAVGGRRASFVSSRTNQDTLKLAARCAAKVTKVADLYTLAVAPA